MRPGATSASTDDSQPSVPPLGRDIFPHRPAPTLTLPCFSPQPQSQGRPSPYQFEKDMDQLEAQQSALGQARLGGATARGPPVTRGARLVS